LIPIWLYRQHLASRRDDPQQRILKTAGTKIHVKFQPVMKSYGLAVNLAAFAGACPFSVAALRGACQSRKSAPAMPKRYSGTGFLAAEIKEYDA